VVGVQSAPPGFLRLAGHPLRWRLLTELARSDRQVRELTGRLGQAQSLISYHLGQLRAGWCRCGAVRPTGGTPTTGSS
jgi:ArsR family transcriptional regulator, arsenate/arsenite/antimonite-responsive transcriptional repressor / arsenate reductase (thioredoxin)